MLVLFFKVGYNKEMKFIKQNFYKLFLITFLVILPVISFAQDSSPSEPVTPARLKNPLGTTTSIPALIQKILINVLHLGIPVVALAIIYCGFLFVAARGNPEKLKKAKEALLYTLIGAAILLGAWTIATLISTTVTSLGK
jgi:hypothetical protein